MKPRYVAIFLAGFGLAILLWVKYPTGTGELITAAGQMLGPALRFVIHLLAKL